MSDRNATRFMIGLLFGVMVGAIVWYWQKSTSAEDGALELLNRLAAADSKLRDLRSELLKRQQGVREPAKPVTQGRVDMPSRLTRVENLQVVRGIGPVFEERLREAGVRSVSQLSGQSPAGLAQILNVSEGRAAAILAEARSVEA